jgi:hypothetical protein
MWLDSPVFVGLASDVAETGELALVEQHHQQILPSKLLARGQADARGPLVYNDWHDFPMSGHAMTGAGIRAKAPPRA